MRCNWRRWLLGVIPLVGIALAAAYLEREAIEQDLAERAARALVDKGAYWAIVVVSGRDVVLTGGATHDNEPVEAEAALRGVWGVRYVNNNAGLPPKVEPFVWAARRRGGRVRLAGYVPDRATRQTIIGMTNAALPGLEVVDRMRVARGVPPTDTWLAGLSFALKQLAGLKQGEVRLEDLAMTISGEAEDATAYQTVSTALKRGLPKGLTLASAQVAAPVVSPFTWSAQFAGGQLVLSGYTANDGAKAKLAAAAPTGVVVLDRMELAGGAPDGWADAAAALIKEIVRLLSGSVEMKDTAVTLAGVAADEAQAQAVRDSLRASLPSAFKLNDQLRVREPKVEAKPPAEPPPPAPAPQPPADQQAKEAPPAPLAEDAQAKMAAPAPPLVEARPRPPEAAPTAPAAAPLSVPVPPSPSEATPKTPPVESQMASPAPQAVASAAPPPESAPPASAPPASAPPAVATTLAPSQAAPSPKPPVEDAPKAAAAPPAVDLAACKNDLATLASATPIAFERGSAKLEPGALDALARLAAAVKACPGVRLAAEGHADIEGSPSYNVKLSVKRAQAVLEYLVGAGVSVDHVIAMGFGSDRPAVPNTTADARAKNRRTQIVVRP